MAVAEEVQAGPSDCPQELPAQGGIHARELCSRSLSTGTEGRNPGTSPLRNPGAHGAGRSLGSHSVLSDMPPRQPVSSTCLRITWELGFFFFFF